VLTKTFNAEEQRQQRKKEKKQKATPYLEAAEERT
jgi:hypothetical protein